MCQYKAFLIAFKIANGICGGALLVLGIYVSELIVAQSTAKTPTITAIATAAMQATSLVVKVLGYTKCARESDCGRRALSVLKGLLVIASVAAATITGINSSKFLGDMHLPMVILIVPGAAMVACNALGWFGLLYNSDRLLGCSGILTLILVLLEIIGIALVHVKDVVRPKLVTSMTLYESTKGVKQAWDYAQINFNCCGVDRASDWTTVNISNGLNSCGKGFEARGCLSAFQEFLSRHDFLIGNIAGLILIIQVCVGVSSIFFSRRTTKQDPRRCIL